MKGRWRARTAAAGHGDNVLGGALVGGGTALGLGTVGAAVNPLVRLVANPVGRATGDLSTPEAVTKATAAAEDAAWAATHQVGFDPSDVNPAYHNALTSLDAGQVRNLSPGMWDKVNGHIAANSNMSTLTANNLDAFGRDIQSAASTPADNVLAARIKSNLDGVMDTATPNWGQTPAGQTPLDLVQRARAATAAAKNASDLADMTTNLNAFKVSPAPEAQRIAREFYWDQPQEPAIPAAVEYRADCRRRGADRSRCCARFDGPGAGRGGDDGGTWRAGRCYGECRGATGAARLLAG